MVDAVPAQFRRQLLDEFLVRDAMREKELQLDRTMTSVVHHGSSGSLSPCPEIRNLVGKLLHAICGRLTPFYAAFEDGPA
jgi:hypothetical protein